MSARTRRAQPSAAPYEMLARMCERELELLEAAPAGSEGELAQLRQARERLIGSLPASPPPAARAALHQALTAQERIRRRLLSDREAALRSLAAVRRARRAADGYAPATARPSRLCARA